MKKLILITIMSTVTIGCSQVNTGEVGIKTSFGKVDGPALSSGLYFYIPFVSHISILSTRVQTVSADSQAASKDLQNVQTQITMNYHLGTQDPVSHFTRLGSDQTVIEDNIVKPAMSEVFKAVVAQYNAEELITKRDVVSQQIESMLSAKLKQYDLYVDSISITGFNFSPAYAQAIEAKQVAEQHAGAAKNVLVQKKIEAEQQIVQAQADAQSMALRKQSITPELIQWRQLDILQTAVEKWGGATPSTYISYGSGSNSIIPSPLMLNIPNQGK